MHDIIMGLRLHIGNIPSINLHYHFLQNSIYTRGYKKIFYFGIKRDMRRRYMVVFTGGGYFL